MADALEKRIKKHIIGKLHRFLAVAPLGFEQTLVDEIEFIRQKTRDESVCFDKLSTGLGSTTRCHSETQCGKESSAVQSADHPQIVSDGKVEFTSKLTDAWKIVAYSRIANRVLMEIANFKAENFRELEKKASEIPWELYLEDRRETNDEKRRSPVEARNVKKDERCNSNNLKLATSNSINIHVTCKHSRLYHSEAITERLEKILSERIIFSKASETSDLIAHPPQHLYVNFLDDRCTIWLDLAGEELYKRGFERFVNEAPLKETIAAAMIFEAIHLMDSMVRQAHQPSDSTNLQDDKKVNLQSEQPHSSHLTTLIDPMSGSGTFSLEAACIANKIIPGICRDFALKHQPAFKETTWKYIIRRENCTTATIANIITSDISERSIEIIKHNIECGPLAQIDPNGNTPTISPQLRDFFSYTAKEIANASEDTSPILVLNPPYGKRLDFDAPKLYTKIGKKLADLARELRLLGKTLTVAILAPKDDTRNGSKYTCTTNLLRECSQLTPKNPHVKIIETSHGGFSLNAIFATI